MTGAQITQLRAQLGLTMSDLATRLDVDVNLVVDWLLSIYSRPQGENA